MRHNRSSTNFSYRCTELQGFVQLRVCGLVSKDKQLSVVSVKTNGTSNNNTLALLVYCSELKILQLFEILKLIRIKF